jgi:hypothetical protein
MNSFRILAGLAGAAVLLAGCSTGQENAPLGITIPNAIEKLDNAEQTRFPFQTPGQGPMAAASVRLSTIAQDRIGGCFGGLDCIPQYSYPQISSGEDATWLSENDLIIGAYVNGQARAYPLVTLWTHEIANDTLGGVRITISYCPLTGTGLNFKGTLDGEPITFGVSGFLYNNNLILYDHQSQSFWPQMLFTAAWGPNSGKQIDVLPVFEMTWGKWKALFPQTTVVSSAYRASGYPYGNYYTDHAHVLFDQKIDSRLETKDLVYGVIGQRTARAYPFKVLPDRAVINDVLDGEPIVVVYDGAAKGAAAYRRPLLDSGEPVSFAVHEETSGPIGLEATNTTGVWNFAGIGISGAAIDTDLVPVATAYKGFWLSWGTYYGGIEIYEE